jgi:hypothetical protein
LILASVNENPARMASIRATALLMISRGAVPTLMDVISA